MPRAEIRRSPCNNRAPNRSPATRATIAFLAMLHKESAGIVAAARFEGNRLLQDLADIREQRLDLSIRQSIDGPLRINVGSIQGLVRVQVPDSGDHVLRQQQRLDAASLVRQ